MPNCVLITNHSMVGVDLHTELSLAPPFDFPFHPHFVAARLRWVLRPSMAESVQCCGFSTMQRGTDIQSFIPHLPVPLAPFNLLCLVLTTFSGSKSEFGVASVQVEGKPIAVAYDNALNYNLNCGDIPTPTGFVSAPNTVISQMTDADYAGGLMAMFVDSLIQAALSSAIGKLGIGGWGEGLLGIFVGTPMGFSANSQGDGLVGIGGRTWSAISDYMRGVAESMAGDGNTGQATRDDAVKSFKKIGQGVVDNLNRPGSTPLSGWDLKNDAKIIFDRPIQAVDALRGAGPRSSSAAFDSPHAEQF